MGHHPLRGIFHRHHAIVAEAGFHRLEHVADGPLRLGADGMAELLKHRRLGEGALGAQVGDFQRQLQGQAGGHYFSEQPLQFLIGQGALVQPGHVLQHLPLPLRPVVNDFRGAAGLFHLAHGLGDAGAAGNKRHQLPIQVVNFPAQGGQIRFTHV